MPNDQVRVNVSFREIPLFQNAALQAVSATGAFLYTESPMPVGTALSLSPTRAPELAIQACVGLVVEDCRGVRRPDGEQPGMSLVFEAGGERLLELLEELPAAAPAELAPAPEAPAPLPVIPMPRRDRVPEPVQPVFEEVPTKVERRVSVSAPTEEPPALQPTASGSLYVEALPPPPVSDEPSVIIESAESSAEAEAEPDQPDKVVMEVEALPGEESEEEGEGEGTEEGGEGAEGGEGEDGKKKKKRTRSRRKKKR
jgi:hypothetical protein